MTDAYKWIGLLTTISFKVLLMTPTLFNYHPSGLNNLLSGIFTKFIG